MTDLRTAAQQALEYWEQVAWGDAVMVDKMDALRAALAQQAEPVASRGWLFRRNADGTIGIFAPPPKPGESQRTSDCVGPNNRDLHELLGKLADHMAALAQQAEPVEPVGEMRISEIIEGMVVPVVPADLPAGTKLYTAPPQLKPLTEEEIDRATAQARDALLDHIYEYGTAAEGVLERVRKLCRAVERAHNITDPQVEDRLARHGIPMPEGDPK